MHEFTIVSAFFDIGRKDAGQYSRSNEQYFEYFKFWGRVKNKIIIYTNKEMGEKVSKFREEIGLLEKTQIVVVENEEEIEPIILKKMVNIEKNGNLENYRFYKGLMENHAKYNYIMLLKYWCLSDAAKRDKDSEIFAWIDFGFNHGGDCYIKKEEFDTLLKTNLNLNKIHLFNINDISNEPIFEIIKNTKVYMMGAPIFINKNLCEIFWELIKHAMESLIQVGFMDDDQVLLLMAYNERKDLFEVHKSNWFMPIKEYCNINLTVKVENKRKDFIKDFIEKLRNKKREYIYIKNEKNNFRKNVK